MNLSPGTTWYVVADGARALILRQTGSRPRAEPDFVRELTDEHLASREIMADRPGRVHDRTGSHRHAVEPKHDAHRQAKYQFIRKLADYLHEAANDSRFDSLILVAAPRALGDLRECLTENVRRRVSREVDKDLTNMPLPDLIQRLRA